MKISYSAIRDWFIIKNRETISGKLLVLCIYLLPVTQFISYLVSTTSQLNYHAYPSLIIFFIFILLRPFDKMSLVLLVIFLSYSLFFKNDTLSGRASYIIPFTLTCISLVSLPKLNVNDLSREKRDLYILVLCYTIIIVFFLTAILRRDIPSKRAYLEGYIIPHAFAYYMAIFGYYFLMRRKYFLASIPLIVGCLVGTRTGVLLSLLALLSFLFIELKSQKFATIMKMGILGGALIILVFIFSSKARSQFSSVFNSFRGFSYSILKNDRTSKKYSSNRSLLLAIGIEEVRKDGISISNIIGRGPRSSYEFINKTLSWKIWFHNDFMEIIFSLGIINLLIYMYAVYYYCRKMKSLFFFMFIVIAAFTNGFFFYSSFTLIGIHYLTVKE